MQTAFVHFVAFCSKPPGIIGSVFRRTTQYSDPAHENVRLQPERDGRVRCSACSARWYSLCNLYCSAVTICNHCAATPRRIFGCGDDLSSQLL